MLRWSDAVGGCAAATKNRLVAVVLLVLTPIPQCRTGDGVAVDTGSRRRALLISN